MPNCTSLLTSESNNEIQIKRQSFTFRIILAGPPCSGKGTQCQLLQQKYGLIHISSGDILRDASKQDSHEAYNLRHSMQNGQLVPDTLMIKLIRKRLSQNDCMTSGWLLDGFPRTFVQAQALKKFQIIPTHIFMLEAPSNLLIKRSLNRRMDPITGKIYNLLTTLPETQIIKQRLIQRHDDCEEVMTRRIDKYLEEINSLKECYKDKLILLDGTEEPRTTFGIICNILETTSPIKSVL